MPRRKAPEGETPAERALRMIEKDMDRTDPVSVQRYTRKGKLRKPKGREALHPNSLAALDRHRAGTQFNGPNARRCKHCRRLAVRELDVCYFHGGRRFLIVMRRNNGRGAIGKTSEIAARNTRDVFLAQLMPPELYRVPIFVEVGRFAHPRIFGVRGRYSEMHVGRRIAAKILLREMIAAWLTNTVHGDPNPWTRAVVKARELGFGT